MRRMDGHAISDEECPVVEVEVEGKGGVVVVVVVVIVVGFSR